MTKTNKQQQPQARPQSAVSITAPLTFKSVDPRALNGAYFNPSSRTTPSALRELLREVREQGIRQPVAVLHRPADGINMVVVDGHRRVEVCELLGLQVPIVIHTQGTVEELWATLNRGNRGVSSWEWLDAYTSSGHKVRPRGKVMSNINACIAAYGSEQELLKAFRPRMISPNIITEVNRVYTETVTKHLLPAPSNNQHHSPLRIICDWMITTKMQDTVGAWTRSGCNKTYAKIMLRSIKDGVPLPVLGGPENVRKDRGRKQS